MGRGFKYGSNRLTIKLWPRAPNDRAQEEEDALRGAHRAGRTAEEEDDYGAKLVKYVPAEALAAFIALSGVPDGQGQRWFVLGVTTVCELIYLVVTTKVLKIWTPFLSVIALFAWVAGTTDYGHDLFKLSVPWQHLTLLSAVFLIPAFDRLFDHFSNKSAS